MKARLIADGGAAASNAEQFFRSPPFLEAEEATHTLSVEGERELKLPLIVRPIDSSGQHDAISPYGYPGADRSSEDPPS